MSLVIKYEGKEFTPASEGLHQAVCVDVVDLGMKDTQYGLKHKVRVVWQIEEINDAGNRQQVMSNFTMSLNPKASLRKTLETWRGRKFTDEELKGFDLEKLVGTNCQVQIVHNIGDEGKVWANVQTVVPVGKGMTQLRPENYVRMKDRSNDALPPPPAKQLVPTMAGADAYDDVPF